MPVIKKGKISPHPKTSSQVVFSILGTWHIKGKNPWDAYEKAAYLKRMISDYHYSIEEIALSISQTVKFVEDNIEAHDLMVENDVYTLEKFSYFYQLVVEKNKSTNFFYAKTALFGSVKQILRAVFNSSFSF